MSARELAELDYMAGMKYKDIASKYGVSINTVKSWKTRHQWDRSPGRKKRKRSVEKKKKVHTKKRTHETPEQIENREKKQEAMRALVKFDWEQERQRLFCLYYMQTHNATSSYQRAYGCTRAAAAASGCRLLKDDKIRMRIQQMKDERDAGILLRATDIVELYMRIAFADISEFVNVKGGRYSVNDLSEVDTQLIESIKPTQDGAVIVQLNDRMKALRWLSDYFELNPRDAHKVEYQRKMAELRERELLSKEEGW